MTSLGSNYVSIDNEEEFLKITNIFVLYYEVYSGKKAVSVSLNDSTSALFQSDRFMFGRVVLQMFSLFNVPLNHTPLQEFHKYPTVSELLLYIYENKR